MDYPKVNFIPTRPTRTGGNGRAAGDQEKFKDGSKNWVRCFVCGYTVDSDARIDCPLCEQDNFRGNVRKLVR